MATHYPPEWLEELRSRSDIVQTVSSYVSLKKNGRNYWGLCPFHGEKTASFSVSPNEQLYYCFGCKAGGTVFNFIMEMERLEYHQAVEFLADRAHMPMPEARQDDHYEQRRMQRERYLNANREAARFYHEHLYSPEGASCLTYLKKRGLSDNVIRKFGLGASPAGYDTVTRYLMEKGYTQEELVRCGLTVHREAEEGKPERFYDMFRNRPMFPIIDQYSNVLGFGGRSLDGKPPKYLNTADTPVFNKRYGVFAANLLRKERHLDRVILVEGYMDVVSLTQFGVTGVCATLGTALTPDQARLLKRFAPMVYLAYDGDSAGQHAILRGLDILEAEGVPARVLDFPDGLDPDEFIRRDGPEAFQKLPAITPETYRLRRLKNSLDLSTQEGRTDYARKAAEVLKPLDPVEREVHLRELILQTGFSRQILEEQIGVTPSPEPKAKETAQRSVRKEPENHDELQRPQEMLISLAATGRLPEGTAHEEDFPNEDLRAIYHSLITGTPAPQLIESCTDPETRSWMTSLLLSPSTENTDELINMATDCVRKIRVALIEKDIQKKKKELENHFDLNRLGEIQELTSRLNRLKERR